MDFYFLEFKTRQQQKNLGEGRFNRMTTIEKKQILCYLSQLTHKKKFKNQLSMRKKRRKEKNKKEI